MKIAKNNTVAAGTDTEELNKLVYEDAVNYINKAIGSLGAYARRTGDAKAKEAIANLSVIMLDLKAE